ncbi:hypothetical protein D3C80_1697130 [compost metagenome]
MRLLLILQAVNDNSTLDIRIVRQTLKHILLFGFAVCKDIDKYNCQNDRDDTKQHGQQTGAGSVPGSLLIRCAVRTCLLVHSKPPE